jgi:hypothetical protein
VHWVRGKAEIIVGNRRRGPIGIVELAFEAEIFLFSRGRKGRRSIFSWRRTLCELIAKSGGFPSSD